MPYYASNTNAEMSAGINHVVNTSHENTNSVTLDGALQADDDRWNSDVQNVATTPHSVLAPYAFSRSANASDGKNFVPGYGFTGSGNGESAQTFNQKLAVRMAGGDD